MEHPTVKRPGTCPACGNPAVVGFFETAGVPALVNYLYPTTASAVECPRGDIALALCQGCGLISNLAFDPSRIVYDAGYQNPLHFSEVFRAYSHNLAEDLVEKFDLRGKKLIEIGCGDGDFLRLLCDLGQNRGVGFDPSYPGSLPTRHERFEIIRDSYSEEYANLDADFFCSRHTLEHIQDPLSLLRTLRNSIGRRAAVGVYVEVPNASHTLRNCFLWDIIYEHPSYFTADSLVNLMEMSDFRIVRVYEGFSGQYLCAEAVTPGASDAERVPQTPGWTPGRALREVEDFALESRKHVERWRKRLEGFRATGKTAVLWGAGSKGVTFLNMLRSRESIDCVVDINPDKQGRFVAGGGQRIVAPADLKGLRPDVVIVANPVYRVEVQEHLGSLDLTPEVFTL